MKITIYNKLKKYDSYLTTAVKANYIRSLTTKEVDELVEIGSELKITLTNRSCGTCILGFMKKLGVPYLEQKEKLKDKKENKE